MKKVIIALILSIIPLILLYAQSKDLRLRSVFARPFVEAAGFIESSALKITGSLSDALYRYLFIVGREEELLALRAAVLETESLRARVADLLSERAAILELEFLSLEANDFRRHHARVVGRAGAPMARMIRIDKGSRQGLTVRSLVLAHEGVVGQVMTVAPDFSDVLLISDASSSFEAKISGSNARGILRGITKSNSYAMEIRDLDGLVNVQKGDLVMTSGLNSNFPAGIPIGKVTETQKSKDGLYVIAKVSPFVSMDNLEHVIVYVNEDSKRKLFDPSTAAWPMAVQ